MFLDCYDLTVSSKRLLSQPDSGNPDSSDFVPAGDWSSDYPAGTVCYNPLANSKRNSRAATVATDCWSDCWATTDLDFESRSVHWRIVSSDDTEVVGLDFAVLH